MRNKKILAVGMIGILLSLSFFCACSKVEDNEPQQIAEQQQEEQPIEKEEVTEPAAVEQENEAEDIAIETNDVEEPEFNLYAEVAGEYVFASGAGAWATFMTVYEDGTFEGNYHDTNMGDYSEEHPYGDIYYSDFTGQFSNPIRIDDFTYTANVETMTVLTPTGTEEIIDGVEYIYSEPYGLENLSRMEFYLPGKIVSELPERYSDWAFVLEQPTETLHFYGMYNVNGEGVFIGPEGSPAGNAFSTVTVGNDGYYEGALIGNDAKSYPDAAVIESVEIIGNTMTVTGNMQYGKTYDEMYDNSPKTAWGTYKFELSDDIVFMTAGEDPGPYEITLGRFMGTVTCYNGLGLILEIKDGKVVEATVSS